MKLVLMGLGLLLCLPAMSQANTAAADTIASSSDTLTSANLTAPEVSLNTQAESANVQSADLSNAAAVQAPASPSVETNIQLQNNTAETTATANPQSSPEDTESISVDIQEYEDSVTKQNLSDLVLVMHQKYLSIAEGQTYLMTNPSIRHKAMSDFFNFDTFKCYIRFSEQLSKFGGVIGNNPSYKVSNITIEPTRNAAPTIRFDLQEVQKNKSRTIRSGIEEIYCNAIYVLDLNRSEEEENVSKPYRLPNRKELLNALEEYFITEADYLNAQHEE